MRDSRFIISAPFGNYVRLGEAIPTLGTFTMFRRKGRFWYFVKTTRPINGGWINQLGLRNRGLFRATRKDHSVGKEWNIISIHGFSTSDWENIIQFISIRNNQLLEFNCSCPNVENQETDYKRIFMQANIKFPSRVIVKLPPVFYESILSDAVQTGIRKIHCCNTFPTPVGGVSGPPLKPYVLEAIRRIRKDYCNSRLTVIGGGGIRTKDDIKRYRDTGADYFSVGSLFLNPRNWVSLRSLIEEANSHEDSERNLFP